MSWFEFVAAVVAICAWPATILIVALLLRPSKRRSPQRRDGGESHG